VREQVELLEHHANPLADLREFHVVARIDRSPADGDASTGRNLHEVQTSQESALA
jgi:hypothetical protein